MVMQRTCVFPRKFWDGAKYVYGMPTMTVQPDLKLLQGGLQDEDFPITKANPAPPSGKDWLRTLDNHTRFVCKNKRGPVTWLDLYGIAAILDECILLYDFQVAMGSPFRWVISDAFSRDRELVRVLPEPSQEEVDNEHHPSLPEPREEPQQPQG